MSPTATRHNASRRPRSVGMLATCVAATVLLVACGADAGEQPATTGETTSAEVRPATEGIEDRPATEGDEPAIDMMTVEGPGFAIQLPAESSWRTVGLYQADANERSGALLSQDPSTALVLVWQEGQHAPGEALDQAFSGLVSRGVDVMPAETIELDIAHHLDATAQLVTLTSTTGTTHGLTAVWTCEQPNRTFALMVHDGDGDEHLAVANLAISGFNCNRS